MKIVRHILFLLAFTPIWGVILYALFNDFDIYNKLISTIFIIFAAIGLIKSNYKLRLPKYFILLVLYILYISYWTYITKLGLSNLLYQIGFVAFFLILINERIWTIKISRLNQVFQLTLLVSLVVILIQVFDSSFLMNNYFREGNANSSIYTARRTAIFSFADKDDIGLSFLPIFSVVLAHEVRKKKASMWIWIIIGATISILTNTRYIMVGYLIVVFQIFYYFNIKVSLLIKNLIILGISGFILFQITQFLGYNFRDFFDQRLFKEGNIEETTRFLAIEAFVEFFKDNWLFGTGLHLTEDIEQFLRGRSSQIHVGYLSHLVSYGVVGSTLLFGFWIAFGRDLFKHAKRTKYYGGFFSFLVFLWANFTFVQYPLISYGLLLSILIDRYYFIHSFYSESTFSSSIPH